MICLLNVFGVLPARLYVYGGKLPLTFNNVFDDREKSRFLKRIDFFSTWTASSLYNGLEAFVRNIVA